MKSESSEMVRCQNPTAETVWQWFDEAGTNTGRDPGARKRQDYPPPSMEVCERVALFLSGLSMWNQPRPSKWPKPANGKDWWGAARYAWVGAAWGWADGGRRPFRTNDKSAAVHFVWRALEHFSLNHSKGAIADAIRHWKEQAESIMEGDLARRGPGLMIIGPVPSWLDGWTIRETLKTKSGDDENHPT